MELVHFHGYRYGAGGVLISDSSSESIVVSMYVRIPICMHWGAGRVRPAPGPGDLHGGLLLLKREPCACGKEWKWLSGEAASFLDHLLVDGDRPK